MKRLRRLRSRLQGLAARRAWNEQGRAIALTLVGLALILAALFCVDWIFDLDPKQRLVAIGAGVLVAVRIVYSYGKSFRANRSTITQTALSLHLPDHGNLVAALQFDDETDHSTGSSQLKEAVIDQVASERVDVYHGFRWNRLRQAVLRLLVIGGIAAGAVALFPLHARVFLNRLGLGQRLYPRSTEVVAVSVNQQNVLSRVAGDEAAPERARCAQGKPVAIYIKTTGRANEQGHIRLVSQKTRAQRSVALEKLTTEQRRQSLQKAKDAVEQAVKERDLNLDLRSIHALAPMDLPALATDAHEPTGSKRNEALQQTRTIIESQLEKLQGDSGEIIWLCRLPRLIEPAEYDIQIGSGRTDSGVLDVAEIPVADLEMQVNPPDYARETTSTVALTRQIAVLEGSHIEVRLRSLTDRPLARASVRVWDEEDASPTTVALEPTDDSHLSWTIPHHRSPFANITREMHYEFLAEDPNGFSIESPIRGLIRVKKDRAPNATAKLVHRVVLPTAAPQLNYRVNDDFGIGQIRVLAQVERKGDDVAPTAEPGVSVETSENAEKGEDSANWRFLVSKELLQKPDLPGEGSYALQLSDLDLRKGDRLRVTLEVQDHRGAKAGVWSVSEPVYLEVSDESGVLSSILESDERSEQRLDDLIRRQLGIGDEP